ncbi:UDP-N-acetylmuramyl pentapeptide phosphotransferase/UDP-N-acetylglucosamine-1-phosphate transferase [Saccharicrinis carchari]|uniref:UDP-N-acetylmuramyl pentapeptide phosphotransferase/UDP-N-acetylglucosamine-1-phosphate transferase n=1 Tax=Saccharicrinis carchari TaxID=1168039 RepID=A0A521ARW2_SACCC|nr:MraY family glycosyltransferase [Saccharicrinis carchari]SMO37526.1 UDP-N-acetylmuramyl pentapeptide phosphotransferase/UDP-N-acetylglucosamine-1-phosphate transferase [Saccharicrinis carchari]
MSDLLIKLLIPLAGLVSFAMVFLSIPTILRVAESKNLYDEPNKRTAHKIRIPTLGGLAIFLSFLFTYSLFSDWFSFTQIPFLIPALLIIFSIGIKDDIMVTAPMIKLFGQILAAFIIVGWGDLRITSFHGFFGLEPNYLTSISISVLLFVFILNGFNLIDGVDGLAAITGMVSITSFSVWFYINGNYHIPVFSAALIGALLAFSYFNIFSKRQKIFMGDTGSLLLGFLLAVVAIRFAEFNKPINAAALKYQMNSAPAVVLAVLIVPVIDTLRVFVFRISKGNSPFAADKNHIHHRMLTLGFSHFHISLIIGAINLAFVVLAFSLRNLGTLRLSLLILFLGILCAYLPAFFIARKKKKLLKTKIQNRHNK